MNKRVMWRFWMRLRDWCERRMEAAWMAGGNCNSCCPTCGKWESAGNTIKTEDVSDGSVLRSCDNCGYAWRAIFTPAGFVPLDEVKAALAGKERQ